MTLLLPVLIALAGAASIFAVVVSMAPSTNVLKQRIGKLQRVDEQSLSQRDLIIDQIVSSERKTTLRSRLNEAGWRTAWSPYAEMIHFELPEDGRAVDGANAIRFDRDIRYLRRRWGKWIEDDPSYNPNLSLAHESLSLAWPPRRSYVSEGLGGQGQATDCGRWRPA